MKTSPLIRPLSGSTKGGLTNEILLYLIVILENVQVGPIVRN